MSQYHIDTNCIHAGYTPGDGEPRVVPIVQSTTYKYDHAETLGKLFDLEQDGFFYTRLANPTLDAVEKKIAALEGGVGALLTSSGQAASLISVLNICAQVGMSSAPAPSMAVPSTCSIRPCMRWGSILPLFPRKAPKKS